jgi:hypothetical protein
MSPIRSASSVFLSCFLSLSLAAQQSTATQQGPILLQKSLAAITSGTTRGDQQPDAASGACQWRR